MYYRMLTKGRGYQDGSISAYNKVPFMSNVLSDMSAICCYTGLRAESPFFLDAAIGWFGWLFWV